MVLHLKWAKELRQEVIDFKELQIRAAKLGIFRR